MPGSGAGFRVVGLASSFVRRATSWRQPERGTVKTRAGRILRLGSVVVGGVVLVIVVLRILDQTSENRLIEIGGWLGGTLLALFVGWLVSALVRRPEP